MHQHSAMLVAAFLAGLAPTPAAIRLAQNCACSWPAGTLDHALITCNKAMVEAKKVSANMTIGGSLISMTDGSKTADGWVTVGHNYDPHFDGQWNFKTNPDKTLPVFKAFSTIFNWSQFEALATNIVPGRYPAGQVDNDCDDYYVFVLTEGGTFNLTSFHQDTTCAEQAQGEDNGKTLVVFNTISDVTLTGHDGLPFGPSVLAPFSTVRLAEDVGFMDGFLIAKNTMVLGSQNQMHGDPYTGPLDCDCTPTAPGTPSPSAFPTLFPTRSPMISTPKSSPTQQNLTVTAPPTMSPTMSKVSGEADPHLVNVRSERFDLMQPGNHTFLLLPRGAPDDKAVLQLRAQVTARGDVCEGRLYITGLNITGSWLGTVGRLYLSTSGETLNQSREVLGLSAASSTKMSLEDFLAAVPSTIVKARQPEAKEVHGLNQHVTMLSVSLTFGPGVIMRVDWEHQKEKVGFSNWLKLSSWGLSRAQMKVGGLLGEDDHGSVVDLPEECSDARGSSTLPGADRKSRHHRATGMVAATASMEFGSNMW